MHLHLTAVGTQLGWSHKAHRYLQSVVIALFSRSRSPAPPLSSVLGSAETPPRAPPTGARVAIQAIRWSLDGERANDDDRDAVFDTASVVPYQISAKHLVTLYWISPISKWVDYQHSSLTALPGTQRSGSNFVREQFLTLISHRARFILIRCLP